MTAPALSLVFAAVIGASLLPPSQATQVSNHDAACPIDADDTVRIYEQVSANTHGGYDSDGATYSTKGQFRAYAVSTCTRSLFSLYGGDMSMMIDAGQQNALKKALEKARAELSDPAEPTVWERYQLAAAMYQALGRGPLFVADLYLEASWTARDEAVGVYVTLRGPGDAREALALGEKELAKAGLTDSQRRTLTWNMLRIAERGGFVAERDRWLAAFEALAPHSPAEAEALARFKQAALNVQPRYQDLAIASYRRALADAALPAEERLRATYLLADLLRRRGKGSEALPMFNVVLSDDRTPRELREMALILTRELSG